MAEDTKEALLVVDDDITYCKLLVDYLAAQGYEVDFSHDGESAIHAILTTRPDLVVLDLMLPHVDGLSVCRSVRQDFDGLILMLTAIDEPTEQVVGLEMGADDYVNKPVSPRVLLARIRALLRRSARQSSKSGSRNEAASEQPDLIQLGDLKVDRANRDVTLRSERVKLTSSEFDLLWLLAEQAGTIVSRGDLHKAMFGLDLMPEDRRVDLIVSRLRKKLQDNPADPAILKTIRSQGYQLGSGI